LIKVHPGRYSRILKDPDHAAFNHTIEIPMPWINTLGLWLLQAGFDINATAKIRVMKGYLVLTTEGEGQGEWE
jgi:hypothetical protein